MLQDKKRLRYVYDHIYALQIENTSNSDPQRYMYEASITMMNCIN